ncbi:MAG: glycosyltransferase [Pseudomonadota bacterium]
MLAPHLAVLLASLANGGIGRTRVNLVNACVAQGVRTDLLMADRKSPYLSQLDPRVRIIDLPTSHPVTGVPALAWYLLRARPEALLTQRIRVNVLAQRARWLARSPTRLYVTANTMISHQLESLSPAKQARQSALMRRYYPGNDGIFAISRAVAEDTAQLLGWPVERIPVIHDPVVTPELLALSRTPLAHPWFQPGESPVILSIGRLEPVKDFPVLLDAFARLRQTRPCRLVILGEGTEREALMMQARALGVAADFELPGFVANPYGYLGRARLFVSSSRFEGLGDALVEALAVGTPVIATHCPGGPVEVLDGGRFGPLVPVGDHTAMSEAMARLLDHPPAAGHLRAGAARFAVDSNSQAYLAQMGLSLHQIPKIH